MSQVKDMKREADRVIQAKLDKGITLDITDTVRSERKLTVKQQRFVNSILKGNTQTQAYRECYDTSKMKEGTIRTEAANTTAKPHVAKAIQDAMIQERERATLSAGGIREFVMQRLVREAEHAGQDGARVRALELLGKMPSVGLFERADSDDMVRDPDIMLDKIKDRMGDFFEQMKIVDGTTAKPLSNSDQSSQPPLEVDSSLREAGVNPAEAQTVREATRAVLWAYRERLPV